MPIATPEIYNEMLDRAKSGGFAYPAINCTSSETINAALKGFADAGSDGIIQFSTGGAEFGSGTGVKDMVTGAVALAEFAHVVAAKYPINVALHTDHCPKDKLDGYVRPLLEISPERVDAGQNPLFQSHMWDGSAVPLDENLEIAAELLGRRADGQDHPGARGRRGRRRGGRRRQRDQREALHHRRDFLRHAGGARLRRAAAATCWPRPSATCTASTSRATSSCARTSSRRASRSPRRSWGCRPARSRSTWSSMAAPARRWRRSARRCRYGVVKMNVDTDTQYAFTRPIVGHMFTNYDGVLKVDGEVGNKKAYDPRVLPQGGRGRHGRPGRRRPARTCSRPAPRRISRLAVDGSARHRATHAARRPGRRGAGRRRRSGPVAAAHPTSCAAWAALAERRSAGGLQIEGYAYARTGYHRGLDALRRAGWRGTGPVPWSHEPNRGFLRALHALAVAAGAIGETDEAERCRSSSPTAIRRRPKNSAEVVLRPADFLPVRRSGRCRSNRQQPIAVLAHVRSNRAMAGVACDQRAAWSGPPDAG